MVLLLLPLTTMMFVMVLVLRTTLKLIMSITDVDVAEIDDGHGHDGDDNGGDRARELLKSVEEGGLSEASGDPELCEAEGVLGDLRKTPVVYPEEEVKIKNIPPPLFALLCGTRITLKRSSNVCLCLSCLRPPCANRLDLLLQSVLRVVESWREHDVNIFVSRLTRGRFDCLLCE